MGIERSYYMMPGSMNVGVKKLNEFAKLPTKGSNYAAGYDVYAATDQTIAIPPHSTIKIGTGLAFEICPGTFLGIFARSGIAAKRGLRPANCVGVLDSDYRGQCIVAVHNDTDFIQYVDPQERIGQIVLLPFIKMDFEEKEELSDTERGTGGFGNTGRF